MTAMELACLAAGMADAGAGPEPGAARSVAEPDSASGGSGHVEAPSSMETTSKAVIASMTPRVRR